MTVANFAERSWSGGRVRRPRNKVGELEEEKITKGNAVEAAHGELTGAVRDGFGGGIRTERVAVAALRQASGVIRRLQQASGGETAGGEEVGDGARAKESTGAGDCKTKKREGRMGVLYIGSQGSIVTGMAAISLAEWGEVERRGGFKIKSRSLGVDASGERSGSRSGKARGRRSGARRLRGSGPRRLGRSRQWATVGDPRERRGGLVGVPSDQ